MCRFPELIGALRQRVGGEGKAREMMAASVFEIKPSLQL